MYNEIRTALTDSLNAEMNSAIARNMPFVKAGSLKTNFDRVLADIEKDYKNGKLQSKMEYLCDFDRYNRRFDRLMDF